MRAAPNALIKGVGRFVIESTMYVINPRKAKILLETKRDNSRVWASRRLELKLSTGYGL